MLEGISRGHLIQPLAQERHLCFRSSQLMQGKKKIIMYIHSETGPFLVLALETAVVKEGKTWYYGPFVSNN